MHKLPVLESICCLLMSYRTLHYASHDVGAQELCLFCSCLFAVAKYQMKMISLCFDSQFGGMQRRGGRQTWRHVVGHLEPTARKQGIMSTGV